VLHFPESTPVPAQSVPPELVPEYGND